MKKPLCSFLPAALLFSLHSHATCGTDYMLPGQNISAKPPVFLILAKADVTHVIAESLSGPSPDNYQVVLKIRLDSEEMKSYEKFAKGTKTLPTFSFNAAKAPPTTELSGTALSPCLANIKSVFGPTATLQKGFDFESAASAHGTSATHPTAKIVTAANAWKLKPEDIEVLVHRYIPASLPQDLLRQALKSEAGKVPARFQHAPISAQEVSDSAAKRVSYMKSDGTIFNPARECQRSPEIKNTPMPETIHSFIILADLGKKTVLATHYYDSAPQNFQTAIKIKLNTEEMKFYQEAKKSSKALPLFQSRVKTESGTYQDSYFCIENLRNQVKANQFRASGMLFQDSGIEDYKLGSPAGRWDLSSEDIDVLILRRLPSLLNPEHVAKDLFPSLKL